MAKDKILKPFVGIIAPENKFTVDTIDDLKSRAYLIIGDIVDLNGYYTAGDGAHHKRKIESADDGSGVQLANGLWANIVHNGEVNVSWFGAKVSSAEDQSKNLQKAIDYSISKSCCIDFSMKQKGQFLLESPIRFSKDAGDTAGMVKFSRYNSFLVDDYKIGDKYAIQFGWPDSSGWHHGRFSGSILGHCFVSSKSRDNKCNGIYLKGAWISSEFLRADNFNGTGINLDSVHDSVFSKLSVERCGSSDAYAFVASSTQGDTFNCTHVVSLQVEQSYNKAINVALLRAVISNIHAERQQISDDFTGDTCVFNLTNSTIGQMLLDGTSDKILKVYFTPYASTFYNVLSSNSEWLTTRSRRSSLINCAITKVTVRHPAESLSLNGCSITDLETEVCNVYSSTIRKVTMTENCHDTTFDSCVIEDIEFSGARTRGGNVFNSCRILKLTSLSDKREIFNNCKIDLLGSSYNSHAVFNNCNILDAVFSDAIYYFYNCFVENWTQTGNKCYITKGTIVKNHITPWRLASNYNHPKGTITERTDGVKGGQIYINDGLGNRPNPDVSGEIVSPWHAIVSWD